MPPSWSIQIYTNNGLATAWLRHINTVFSMYICLQCGIGLNPNWICQKLRWQCMPSSLMLSPHDLTVPNCKYGPVSSQKIMQCSQRCIPCNHRIHCLLLCATFSAKGVRLLSRARHSLTTRRSICVGCNKHMTAFVHSMSNLTNVSPAHRQIYAGAFDCLFTLCDHFLLVCW